MAKPLDPKAIEAERQTSSRAERREQKRRQMQDEISYNQRGNGVIIPPQKRRELAEEPSKLRVAAYCRVSTQEEQQVGSFDMQIHHFTKRIEANPQWELVEIYQDEGISATTVEKRLGFQEMIADAVDGKIDLILTKSISRFGRNIVDILDNLQTLSALNPPVSVEFETEGTTYTGDGGQNWPNRPARRLQAWWDIPPAWRWNGWQLWLKWSPSKRARQLRLVSAGGWQRVSTNSPFRIRLASIVIISGGLSLSRPRQELLSTSMKAAWRAQPRQKSPPH